MARALCRSRSREKSCTDGLRGDTSVQARAGAPEPVGRPCDLLSHLRILAAQPAVSPDCGRLFLVGKVSRNGVGPGLRESGAEADSAPC